MIFLSFNLNVEISTLERCVGDLHPKLISIMLFCMKENAGSLLTTRFPIKSHIDTVLMFIHVRSPSVKYKHAHLLYTATSVSN